MLHAGGSHRIWMGFCVLMNLGASSGQMRIIPVITAEGAEVNIHIFGAIDIGILIVVSMLTVVLVYIAVIHDGALARG